MGGMKKKKEKQGRPNGKGSWKYTSGFNTGKIKGDIELMIFEPSGRVAVVLWENFKYSETH